MPTQHTVTSYQFGELSDKAKEVAREWYREGALDYDWWACTYDDASAVGLKLKGFDLGRSQNILGTFTKDAVDVARAIVEDHGNTCATFALAEAFLDDTKGEPTEDQSDAFLRALLSAYWDILNSESEFLTSDDQIDETITANGYDFHQDGRRFRF